MIDNIKRGNNPASTLIGVLITLFTSFNVSAQSINAASQPDISVASAGAVGRINCDMLKTGAGYLNVIVWDDSSTGDAYLYITDGSTNDGFTISGGSNPDVVLGYDGSSYMIGLVYEVSGDVFFESYLVTISGSVSIGTIYSPGAQQLNSNTAGSPHIDLWHDISMPPAFLDYLYSFAIVWHEWDGSTQYDVNSIFGGNLNTPSTFTSAFTIQNAMYPDIAWFTELPPPQETYFTICYTDNAGQHLYANEFNVTQNNPSSPITLYSGNSVTYPRIDAGGWAERSPGFSDWQVVATVDVSGNRRVKVYDQNSNNLISSSFTYLSSFDYHLPVICAGPGDAGPGGTNWFGLVFYPLGDSSMYFNWDHGLNYNGPWYEVNSGALSISYDPAIAISSSTNYGDNLMAAWFDGSDVLYKITAAPNWFLFKPTDIPNASKNDVVSVYPNPANQKLNVSGIRQAHYAVSNLTGKVCRTGCLDAQNCFVDISALQPGIYILTVTENDKVSKQEFIRE